MSRIHVLDQDADSTTLAWACLADGSQDVEIRVNDEPPKVVAIASGILRKKNLKRGDVLRVRVLSGGAPGLECEVTHEFVAHAPAPMVRMELGDVSGSAVATVEGKVEPGANLYEVHALRLDSSEWDLVSDSLKNPAVRKKNLNAASLYSFRYRAFNPVAGQWGPWSAASLPIKAPKASEAMAKAVAPTLLRGDGSTADSRSALSDKLVLLYFSAHWCPPCRATTPKLVEFHRKLRELGKPVEFVFVSGDQDEKSFKSYFAEMPNWYAVNFHDERREGLQMEHKVTGIPSLKVISGKTGKMIEADALRYPLAPATVDAWLAKM